MVIKKVIHRHGNNVGHHWMGPRIEWRHEEGVADDCAVGIVYTQPFAKWNDEGRCYLEWRRLFFSMDVGHLTMPRIGLSMDFSNVAFGLDINLVWVSFGFAIMRIEVKSR